MAKRHSLKWFAVLVFWSVASLSQACGDDASGSQDGGTAGSSGSGGGGSSGSSGSDKPSEPARWVTLVEELPGSVLSIWSGDGLVYAVGADGGNGPVVLRHSDGAWEQLDSGVSGDLWWVTSDGDGQLWMVGEDGMVLRHGIGSDAFEQIESGTDATLFGIFFTDSERAWTVGGWVDDSAAGPDGQRGVVLMLQGDSFVPDARVPPDVLAARAIFKVWGRDPDDLWLVGERGVLLHADGGDFEAIDTMVRTRLLTIHGAADFGPVAVGGANNAVLLELVDDAFVDRSFDVDEGFAPALNGVYVVDADRTAVVGNRGFVAERDAQGEFVLPDEPPTELHLHAVTVDASGGAWAVGGDLLSGAFDRGLILYKGNSSPAQGL